VRVVDLDEADVPLRDRPLPQPDDVSAEFWATVRAYAFRVRDDLGIPFWRPAP
jgi:hypothetical protein